MLSILLVFLMCIGGIMVQTECGEVSKRESQSSKIILGSIFIAKQRRNNNRYWGEGQCLSQNGRSIVDSIVNEEGQECLSIEQVENFIRDLLNKNGFQRPIIRILLQCCLGGNFGTQEERFSPGSKEVFLIEHQIRVGKKTNDTKNVIINRQNKTYGVKTSNIDVKVFLEEN